MIGRGVLLDEWFYNPTHKAGKPTAAAAVKPAKPKQEKKSSGEVKKKTTLRKLESQSNSDDVFRGGGVFRGGKEKWEGGERAANLCDSRAGPGAAEPTLGNARNRGGMA